MTRSKIERNQDFIPNAVDMEFDELELDDIIRDIRNEDEGYLYED